MRSFLLRFFLLLAASYGLLYFSHKFYQPALMQHHDFMLSYYWMYQSPLDFMVANAPFIYRQVSGILTHALFAAGVYYPNEIAFANPAVDPRLYFAALAANYLGLVSAAALAGEATKKETGGFVFPLLAGLFCVLSFHAQSVVITGLTEGVSWLFFAVLYLLYVREARTPFAILLAVSIFQRELISASFALIAGFALLIGQGSRRYNGFVLATAILCFAAYGVMRFYVIAVPGYDNQLSPLFLLRNLLRMPITLHDLTFLVLLSQNVILISAAIAGALWLKAGVVPRDLFVLLLSFAAIVVIGVAEGVGANVGRAVGLLSPAFAALAARDLFRLEEAANARRAAE